MSNQIASKFQGAPVTKYLLILNILFFMLDVAGAGHDRLGRLAPYLAFTVPSVFYDWQVWRLIGFQFLHGDLFHLFFNMFAIYMFGATVEQIMGSRRFLAYYLLCGVAGALFYSFLVIVGWLETGVLVGASAGIFGILVALIVVAPDMRVMLLFPPIPMKLKTFGMIILGFGVFTVMINGNNAGGEAGHLGGALLGFILMRKPGLLDWAERIGSGASMRMPQRKKKATRRYEPKIKARSSMREDASEIDRILDKVSAEGIHSLTELERKKLLDVSQKNNE
ncbi:rhomboid family intramembrane serine protease [Rubritalea marina]|uniref:rhomboid family intramembrane serine protease n=1 Tax=Rubritalea marina TaxID=361055 RepID=UPI0006870601|nr:rhomboid family intramembrane serine protease [Rubritalea marina]